MRRTAWKGSESRANGKVTDEETEEGGAGNPVGASAKKAGKATIQALPGDEERPAERTIQGVEAANMMRKRQVKRLDGRDTTGQARFVESLFGVAA